MYPRGFEKSSRCRRTETARLPAEQFRPKLRRRRCLGSATVAEEARRSRRSGGRRIIRIRRGRKRRRGSSDRLLVRGGSAVGRTSAPAPSRAATRPRKRTADTAKTRLRGESPVAQGRPGPRLHADHRDGRSVRWRSAPDGNMFDISREGRAQHPTARSRATNDHRPSGPRLRSEIAPSTLTLPSPVFNRESSRRRAHLGPVLAAKKSRRRRAGARSRRFAIGRRRPRAVTLLPRSLSPSENAEAGWCSKERGQAKRRGRRH